MRVQLLNRVFQGQDSSDLIRQIELACAKYTCMVSTLSGESAGLAIGHSDMSTMLVRALPADVRNYCLMHSSGESYTSYRLATNRASRAGGASGRNHLAALQGNHLGTVQLKIVFRIGF